MKDDNKIYAVIDTNVLVSALFSNHENSNPGIIINQVLEGNITPLVNASILQEYREVLSRLFDKSNFKNVNVLSDSSEPNLFNF